MFITLVFLQPGYSIFAQWISELDALEAPHTIIMNVAGFSVLGLLMIAFVSRFKNENRWKRYRPYTLATGLMSATLLLISPSSKYRLGIFK